MAEDKKEKEEKFPSRREALENLRSKGIQQYLGSFIGCNLLTNSAKNCKSGLTANKFVNSITGEKYDCNLYCLRACSPDSLTPLFEKIPSFVQTTSGNLKITEIDIIISNEEESVEQDDGSYSIGGGRIFIYKRDENEEKPTIKMWKTTNVGTIDVDDNKRMNSYLATRRLTESDNCSNLLCEYIRKLPDEDLILFVRVRSYICDPVFDASIRFVSFNQPYVRPANQWTSYRTENYLVTSINIHLQNEPEKE